MMPRLRVLLCSSLVTITALTACEAPPPPTVQAMIEARWAGTGQEARAVRIARCESKLNPHAQNRRSSAYGIFQFLNSTWRSTGIAKTSDPRLQVEAAFRLWKQRGWSPWVCRG